MVVPEVRQQETGKGVKTIKRANGRVTAEGRWGLIQLKSCVDNT